MRVLAASALPFYDRMKKMLLASIALSGLVLWAVSCSGGKGGGGTPTGPSTNPPPQAQASTTVNIIGSAGGGAFNPNPVQVPTGGTIQWRNSTPDPHVLVMADGTPIGTLAPGASITTTLSGGGGNFRCTNHPTMVGSINGATVPDPPPPGADPGY
jgi:plastocyanin